MRNVALATVLVLFATACKLGAHAATDAGTDAAPAASASATPPPATTAPTAAAPIPPPNWAKNAPSRPVRAKVGDLVWAMAASDSASDADIGRLNVFKVDAINGNVASVSNKSAGKHDVPGFFVLPVGDATRLKAGDAVVVPYGFGWGFARVVKNDKGAITAHLLLSDKTTKDIPVEAATAVPTNGVTAPFSDVYFEKYPGKNYSGMVIAEDAGTAWVLNHDSGVVSATKTRLMPLKWAFKDRKVGDKVVIFAGMGASNGTIAKVLDPKDFFEVSFDGTSMSASYDQVTDKL